MSDITLHSMPDSTMIPDVVDDENAVSKDESREDEREDLFIENLHIYRDPVQAALESGYSRSYAVNIKSNKFKSRRFLEKVKQRYIDQSSLKLIGIDQIEAQVILECLEDTSKVPKLAPILKQIKQAAGVLAQEAPSAPIVNIKELKMLITQGIPDKAGV